jgi:rRNA processing protein Gar1
LTGTALLGTVIEVGRDGMAVAVCVSAPETGDAVFDARGKRIGVVKRVFGPVDRPYVSVLLDRGADAVDLAGKEVYSKRGTQNAKDKRRNRRD